MAHSEFSTQASDGTALWGQAWLPENDLKGIICLIHGLGEHTSRYDHVAEIFNANGLGLVGFDRRGHGKSGGKRGHIPGYASLLEEVDITLEKGMELAPGKSIYLYGHSWGGNIVANYLVRKTPDLAGAILTGAWLRLPQEPPAIKVFLAKIMNVIYPAWQEDNQLDPKDLSHDQSVVQAYENDPLVHSKITARNFLESSGAATFALENASKNKLRTLIMHGSDDKMTSPKGSVEFYEATKGNSTLKIWEGLYHEVHNELKKGLVLGAMLDWLNGKDG